MNRCGVVVCSRGSGLETSPGARKRALDPSALVLLVDHARLDKSCRSVEEGTIWPLMCCIRKCLSPYSSLIVPSTQIDSSMFVLRYSGSVCVESEVESAATNKFEAADVTRRWSDARRSSEGRHEVRAASSSRHHIRDLHVRAG